MLAQRIATGLAIGIGLTVFLLWLPPLWVAGLFVLVILAAAWEWAPFASLTSPLQRVLYVLVIAGGLAALWYVTRVDAAALQWVLRVAFVWWVIAFLWIVVAPAVHTRFTAAASGILILVPAGVALAHLYSQSVRGPEWVLFLLLLVWAADVGAFFGGRSFGRLKLAPRVSPQKTWEGLLGGVIVSLAVAAAGVWWFARPPLAFIPLCLGVVLISIVGDLTESMYKRYAGLKDSGSIFPGHGGVLDRFDSVCAAAPVFVLGLQYLEWLP